MIEAPAIESIPPESVIEQLQLTGSSRPLLNSIRGSLWGKINEGRIILEARTLSVLQQARSGTIFICDLDDCLMSATSWHQKEFQLLEQNDTLKQQGINISAQRASEVYELSKICIPSVAEKEPRYTPRLNLILLGIYADALKEGIQLECPEEQAWDQLLDWRETINQQVQTLGERVLRVYAVHPLIQKIFMSNPPLNFLYREFVQDVLATTRPSDIRIIATRGKIEGLLGQIYKVHASGLMRQRSWTGQGVDLVVYSNDVKTEALLSLMRLLPEVGGRLIRIYDDNPNEVLPYLEAAKNLGARNIEVIQVSHPDAKRRDLDVGVAPSLIYMRGATRFRHFVPDFRPALA